MGLIAALLARSWLQSHSQTQAIQNTILVARIPLAFGTQIADDQVVEIPWVAASLPDGAFATKGDFFKEGKRMALGPIGRNEPILASKITAPGQRGSLSSLLEGGMRAVTVRVDDVRGVAGFILPGDRVDVVLIHAEGSEGSASGYADLLLQNVKVLAVDQLVNERPEQANVVAKAVTLEVTAEQSQKIILASNIGKLSLTLRQPGQDTIETAGRITEKDLGAGRPAAPALVVAAPVPAAVPVPVKSNDSATVAVIRDLTREEYKVPRHD